MGGRKDRIVGLGAASWWLGAALGVGAIAGGPAARGAGAVNDAAMSGAQGWVTDSEFASLMNGALIKDGKANVESAVFLFQECYGGGMIDNLAQSLGTTVPWVAGSASAADQPAAGQVSTAEATKAGFLPELSKPSFVVDNPTSFWTNTLAPSISESQNVLSSITTANANDPVGPDMDAFYTINNKVTHVSETGQSASANGGDKITYTDSGASQYQALLWAGNPNVARHPNNITAMYNALAHSWADHVFNITILYGNYEDGTAPAGVPWQSSGTATYTGLRNILPDLNLNPSTEFVFYATDHGESTKPIASTKKPVPSKTKDEEDYSLDPSVVTGIDGDAGWAAQEDTSPGFDPYMPYVEVDYDSLIEANTVGVYAGSDFLGYLPASPGSDEDAMDFNIPYGDVNASGDSITLDNEGLTSFNLDEEDFYSGEDGDDPGPLPEPGSVSVIMMGAVGMAMRRGRSRA